MLREYERGVLFRLGRLRPLAGPGLVLLLPFVDRMIRVDLRTVTLTIPPQEVITRDNVPARVNAVAYFRVVDPALAITEVEAYPVATSQIAQTTLRSVLGRAELDTLLSERDELNDSLRRIIDEQTEPWGIKVTTVEIKDVEIPEAMQRAMARAAEAERERRAKIISAEGEFQASQKLLEASKCSAATPPRCSCATSRPSSSSAARSPPSCSPSRWTSSRRSWQPRAGAPGRNERTSDAEPAGDMVESDQTRPPSVARRHPGHQPDQVLSPAASPPTSSSESQPTPRHPHGCRQTIWARAPTRSPRSASLPSTPEPPTSHKDTQEQRRRFGVLISGGHPA